MRHVKVRFLRTYTVSAVDGATYPEGSVHLLREDTADHFIRRGVAVMCPVDAPVSEPPKVVEQPRAEPPKLQDVAVTLISSYNRRLLSLADSAEPEPPTPETKPVEIVPPPISGPPTPAAFEGEPLVSCVMPTWNRQPFIKAAIDCWLRQTYENRELIVLDDGDESVRDLVPRRKGIRYIRNPKREITGAKRNHVNQLAKGEIICHWDDDDWSAIDRIAHQVELLRQSGKPITGYGTVYFWDVVHQEARRYRAAVAGYVCGTTLCYFKSYWEEHKFPLKQEASDNGFIYPALKLIANSHDASHMVARIHDCHHTSSKTGINEKVDKDFLPAAFWDDENARLTPE